MRRTWGSIIVACALLAGTEAVADPGPAVTAAARSTRSVTRVDPELALRAALAETRAQLRVLAHRIAALPPGEPRAALERDAQALKQASRERTLDLMLRAALARGDRATIASIARQRAPRVIPVALHADTPRKGERP